MAQTELSKHIGGEEGSPILCPNFPTNRKTFNSSRMCALASKGSRMPAADGCLGAHEGPPQTRAPAVALCDAIASAVCVKPERLSLTAVESSRIFQLQRVSLMSCSTFLAGLEAQTA